MEEKRYQSATQVFALYGRFFKHVQQETDLETALKLQANSGEEGGIRIGKWMKDRKGVKTLTPETFLPILKEINAPFGYDSTYTIQDNSIKLNTNRCPWYQGFRISGHSHDMRGDLCGHFLRAFFKGLKQEYPNIEYNLDFREDKDGKCVETISFT